MFRQSCLKKTTSIANRLKRDWTENKGIHLGNILVDIGATTKLKLQKANIKS